MRGENESGRTCERCGHCRHGAQFAPLPNGERSQVCMFCADPKAYPLSEPLPYRVRQRLKTRWSDRRTTV
jgi:hypothetical protein